MKEGYVVGYTEDGQVFLSADTKDPNGKPMQIHFMWHPDKAMELAKDLLEASDKCHRVKKARLII